MQNPTRLMQRFRQETGILELMADMAKTMNGDFAEGQRPVMLGGGNPALIPEVMQFWRQEMEEMLSDGDRFERLVSIYDAPGGRPDFKEALADFLRREYHWPVTAANITVFPGAQLLLFAVLNLYSGPAQEGERLAIFPMMPEYLGYADQYLKEGQFCAVPSRIELRAEHAFKCRLDQDALQTTLDLIKSRGLFPGLFVVSRPSNPSGNVLTDEEIQILLSLARREGIPLVVDAAYGQPFPGISFAESSLLYEDGLIISLSLSKLGLPGVRNSIVVSSEQTAKVLSNISAIWTLSNPGLGQALVLPLLKSGEIKSLVEKTISPWYRRRSHLAVSLLQRIFGQYDFAYRLHAHEGALFFWVWFPDLVITSRELYEQCKVEGLIVVPGTYFVFGFERSQDLDPQQLLEASRASIQELAAQSIRVNYAAESQELERGFSILARVVSRSTKKSASLPELKGKA